MAALLAVFDQTPDDVERIMQLMQEMQSCGAPPAEIMADFDTFDTSGGAASLPPELQDELSRGCAQQ